MIKEGYYINERRWDVTLDNNILLNLSEINIEESLKNYIKLIKKFNNLTTSLYSVANQKFLVVPG